MTTKSRTFNSLRIFEILLPVMVITLGMQFLRLVISGLAWYMRDALKIGTLSLLPYAVGTFLLGFLAAVLRRLAGPRLALWVTAGGIALVRLVEQLSTSPAADFWLSIAGVGLFLNFLPVFMGHLRVQGERAAERWTYGLVVGLAFDNGLRTIFGVRDLSTISGVIPLATIAVIAVVIFWALWREPAAASEIPSETTWKRSLPLIAIGPILMLQMLFFQSHGWVEEVAHLSTPLGFVIVMLGNLAAAIGAAWGFARPRTFRPLVALGITIYLILTIYVADQLGMLIVVTLLIGQWLMGWGWAMIAGVGAQADRPGLGRTTVALAGGMLLFFVCSFAFYVAQDIAMPFPRQVFPAFAAALVGLFFLLASAEVQSLPAVAAWDLSGISAAGILLIVALVTWALMGSAPAAVQPSGFPIKVMTYNIHSGFSMAGRQDLEAIAKVIEDADPDIVVLQEVSRVRLMDGSPDLSTWFSRRLGMPVIFQGTEEPIWGNAILSRYPVLESGSGDLPRAGTLIGRGYLWAGVDVGGPQPLLVIATHLHHIDDEPLPRQAQVPVILEFWNEQGFSLLMGDLNAKPDSVEMGMVAAAGMVDSWGEAGEGLGLTSSSGNPEKRIDWIWHTDDMVAVEIQVLQTLASDHFPVLATLDLSP